MNIFCLSYVKKVFNASGENNQFLFFLRHEYIILHLSELKVVKYNFEGIIYF